MTLPELAAFAARVEGFERPVRETCRDCNGELYVTEGQSYLPCFCKDSESPGMEPEDPAALLMAVMLYARKHHGDVEMNGASVAVHAMQIGPGLKPVMRRGRAAISEETEESIARAALVALLRAHGVEVPG